MKVILENLGVLKHAEFELGDLTVICGKNNMGKTYATHALHGFLHEWPRLFEAVIERKIIPNPRKISHSSKLHDARHDFLRKPLKELEKNGVCEINLQEYIEKYMEEELDLACRAYNRRLPRVLSASRSNLATSQFSIELGKHQNILGKKFDRTITIGSRGFVQMTKESGSPVLKILFLRESEKNENDFEYDKMFLLSRAKRRIQLALMDIIYSVYFPNAFIISPERTGASLFRNELDFARNRIVEELVSEGRGKGDFSSLDMGASRYSLAVRENVDYIRGLDEVLKKDSFLSDSKSNEYNDILQDLKGIVKGHYAIDKVTGEPIFIPQKSKIKLKMGESSSSVRALLMLDVYLYHTAQKGDLLIIDEPELNLHPENQRRLARLFARLVNVGIKVFITTHSDYIIRELNNLIKMSEKDLEAISKIEEKQKYHPNELLRLNGGKESGKDIKAYIAEEGLVLEKGKKRKVKRQILKKAEVTKKDGMMLDTFDNTIREINRVQDKIDWG